MIINEQGQTLAANKVTDHIYLKDMNSFLGESFHALQDVYISLIAHQQHSYLTLSAQEHYNIKERNSMLLFVEKNKSFSIKSNKLDSKCLLIVFNKSFIDQLVLGDETFLRLIQCQQATTIEDATIYPISIEISRSQIPKYLKNIHQKSKTLEIFYKQLAAIARLNEKDLDQIRHSDIKKVNEAKTLIDADVAQSYTIQELARIIGTNEQYLKKHFKQLYGTTIYNYMLQNKMNHAKELLHNGDEKIADIASKIGYKHATHFTTAFKKYFGFLPNALRYQWIAYLSSYSIEIESLILL